MNLKLVRKEKTSKYTIGDLYINDKFFCNTIEDVDRGLSDEMSEAEIKAKKVYGKTAIPTGTYDISMNTVSNKFKDRSWAKPFGGKLPRLLDVKGFEGVLTHVGNTEEDSLGCLLVGKHTLNGRLTDSTSTFNKLMKELLQAHLKNEKINISIT